MIASPLLLTEKFLVSPDAGLYHFINQGCLTVETINDKEEMEIVDVCSSSACVFAVLLCCVLWM